MAKLLYISGPQFPWPIYSKWDWALFQVPGSSEIFITECNETQQTHEAVAVVETKESGWGFPTAQVTGDTQVLLKEDATKPRQYCWRIYYMLGRHCACTSFSPRRQVSDVSYFRGEEPEAPGVKSLAQGPMAKTCHNRI